MTPATVTLDIADRLDLVDLYARYALLFDTGDADGWADVFAPDGRFFIDGGPTLTGTEELSRFARRAFVRTPGIRHLNSNVTVDGVGPAAARGSAYVVVVGTGDDGSLIVLTVGDYADDLVKLDGRWRIQTRTFSRWAKPQAPIPEK